MFPAAVIVCCSAVFIAGSLYFRFAPRLRVIVGLLVGSLITGVLASTVSRWLADGARAIGGPLGRLLGQRPHDIAEALPGAVGLALAIVIVMYLRGSHGGSRGGGLGLGGGGRGRRGGGASAGARSSSATLPHVALACAVLLPMVIHAVAVVGRSVAS